VPIFHFTGPSINEVVDPPLIAPAAVFETVNRWTAVVVSIPDVNVNVPLVLMVVATFNVTPYPPVDSTVKFFKAVVEDTHSGPVVILAAELL
jgi:hypothetical protein